MCNDSFGLLVRNNVIADGDVNGLWPDCGSTGIVAYGNAMFGIKSSGFYIEDRTSTGSVLRWNTVSDCGNGIMFRQNMANTAFENYVFNNRLCGLGIGTCDAIGVIADSMTYNWVVGNAGAGATFGPDLSKLPATVSITTSIPETAFSFSSGISNTRISRASASMSAWRCTARR